MTHLLLLMAGLGATHHHAPLATWQRCSSRAGCRWYEMPRATHRPLGHTHWCTTSPAATVCVTFPRFEAKRTHREVLPTRTASRTAVTAPVGRTVATSGGRTVEVAYVTGYSWGCGTPNPTGANGYVPFVGMVSNDSLAFGTRVYIPSLGYSGVVEDRGVGTGGFDLFEPSCAVAYTVTGWRQVVIG